MCLIVPDVSTIQPFVNTVQTGYRVIDVFVLDITRQDVPCLITAMPGVITLSTENKYISKLTKGSEGVNMWSTDSITGYRMHVRSQTTAHWSLGQGSLMCGIWQQTPSPVPPSFS